jgi:transposase, IS5 family
LFLANCTEVLVGSKPTQERSEHDLFRTEVVNLSDIQHELARLAELTDWQAFTDEWSVQFTLTTGRQALPTRLMASLLYLKHTYALSDEEVVERRCENPYRQYFNGEQYFRYELPCDPSSLVRWRQRIGEAGCEWLLAHSLAAAGKGEVIKRRSLDEGVLDTSVQSKAIAYPTDSRLLNRAANNWSTLRNRRESCCARATPEWARRQSIRQGPMRTPSSAGECSA